MLLVDDRIGSKDMLVPLKKYGVDAEITHLLAGDFAFIGRGIGGADVQIGIELKRFGVPGRSDLLTSVYSGRFAGHQLIELESYDRAWLLTEGLWRASDEGVLETYTKGNWTPLTYGRRAVMSADVDSWILTQMIRGGMQHRHCSTRRDTVRFLAVLYSWWTRKDLEAHRSHQAIYLPPPDKAAILAPSPFVKAVVSLVDGLGWEKAHAIEESNVTHVNGKPSIRRLGMLSARELQSVKGIGKTLAQRIVSALGES